MDPVVTNKKETAAATKADTQDTSRQTLEAVEAGSHRLLLAVPKLLGVVAALSPLALAAGIIAVALWWYEHDAHIRQNTEIHEVQKQTEAHVADLQKQAAQAIHEATVERAQRIVQLESARQASERDAANLRQRLAALQGEEQAQLAQVAALSGPDVVKQVATRLGLGPDDLTTSGTGAGSSAPSAAVNSAGNAEASTASTLPARGGQDSGSSLPQGGTHPPEFPPTSPADVALSPEALRQVDTALVQLDGCQKQAVVRDRQVSACQEQVTAQSAIIDQQKASMAELNTALADKDKIIAERDSAYRQEMKIAHGTWTSRVAHTLEHVAIGVAIGVAIVR